MPTDDDSDFGEGGFDTGDSTDSHGGSPGLGGGLDGDRVVPGGSNLGGELESSSDDSSPESESGSESGDSSMESEPDKTSESENDSENDEETDSTDTTDLPFVDESETHRAPDWGLAIFSLLSGIILYTGGVVALLSGIEQTVVQVGAGLGTVALAYGVRATVQAYRAEAERRHQEQLEAGERRKQEILTAIERVESALESPLESNIEKLLEDLRTQRELITDLAEESDTMTHLAEDLKTRHETIETEVKELVDGEADSGGSPGHGTVSRADRGTGAVGTGRSASGSDDGGASTEGTVGDDAGEADPDEGGASVDADAGVVDAVADDGGPGADDDSDAKLDR